MKYVWDNDLHIHSSLSLCSNDPQQTPGRILEYARVNGLKQICLTDHFWDETVEGASDWYRKQDWNHICQALPLPQAEGIRFFFGCETELDRFLTVGISKKTMDKLDFVIIPTTHFHMKGYTLTEEQGKDAASRAAAWVSRLEAVLNRELPFHKIGLAHLTCSLIAPTREEYLETLRRIPADDMKRLFSKAAKAGVGIELNSADMSFAEEEKDLVLAPYRVARDCGCRFYCGSDAHHPKTLETAGATFRRAIDLLELEEEDKFLI